MKGQWMGSYTGTVDGRIMINIDHVDTHFEISAYLIPDNEILPPTYASIVSPNIENEFTAEAKLFPIDRRTMFVDLWENIKTSYPDDVVHSDTANVNFKLNNDYLEVKAISNIGIEVYTKIAVPSGSETSKVNKTKASWDEFKRIISKNYKSGFIFRGQTKPWKLRTAFHRQGRFRIDAFNEKDINQLYMKLGGVIDYHLDLNNPQHLGAFVNLLQHHGYPTPLLDWSHSPYVAAFFAFRDLPKNYKKRDNVRIYIFDKDAWVRQNTYTPFLIRPYPYLSVMEFIPFNNPRVVPQQALTTVTNISDIEKYILDKESEMKCNFIRAIDIPCSERDKVMSDLKFMGITAGSMFPGIDGVCEEMKENNFGT